MSNLNGLMDPFRITIRLEEIGRLHGFGVIQLTPLGTAGWVIVIGSENYQITRGEAIAFIKGYDLRAKEVELLQSPIRDLDLGTRVNNLLGKAWIRTIGDLASSSESKLEKIDGCGKVMIQLIKDALTSHGLALAPEPAQKPT